MLGKSLTMMMTSSLLWMMERREMAVVWGILREVEAEGVAAPLRDLALKGRGVSDTVSRLDELLNVL